MPLKNEIFVMVNGERKIVKASAIVGVWAANKQENGVTSGKGYAVTHIPSGLRALSCGTLALAKRVIAGLPQIETTDGLAPAVLDACAKLGVRAGAYNEFSY